MIRTALAFVLFFSGATFAQALDFPSNASLTSELTVPLASQAFPTDVWAGEGVPIEIVEGALSTQAWRLETASLTSLQIMRPLREQLRNDRFDVLFECADVQCGGFDFRFAIDVLPPPEMLVSLNDYRFLTARKDAADGIEMVSILVSRNAFSGYVQVTSIAPRNAAPLIATVAEQEVTRQTEPLSDIATQLERTGRAILGDLSFETGSAQLAQSDFASLSDLAVYLAEDANRRIALVGHTDASGDLAPNIALSERRAASVLERLVTDFGIPRRQVAAQGVGFLMPLSSNATEEGRQVNRRVEAVLLIAADQ